MKKLSALILFCSFSSAFAATDTAALNAKFGFFVDANYSRAFNQPGLTRSYFTTPARSNEFALNLALVQAKVETQDLQATLSLHTGSSVYQYYSSEPRDATAPTGSLQMADILTLVHEANAGYHFTPNLVVTAGIFAADLAGESFISSQNYNYSRSMIADFSPYFLTGVRANYQLTQSVNVALGIVNGYHMVDTNSQKSLLFDIKYEPSPDFSFVYHTLLGDEVRPRMLNNFVTKYRATDYWETKFVLALGFQEKPGGGHYAYWWTLNSSHKFKLTDTLSLGARLEYYWDKYQVHAQTATVHGFQTASASVNVDKQLTPNLVWRNELRYLNSLDPIFTSNSGTANATVYGLTSMAFTLL